MKVSRRSIEWAHGPGAEDGQPLATSLCELANGLCRNKPASNAIRQLGARFDLGVTAPVRSVV